jgi:hypothetical protein
MYLVVFETSQGWTNCWSDGVNVDGIFAITFGIFTACVSYCAYDANVTHKVVVLL